MVFDIQDILVLARWPRKLAQFAQTLYADHESGIWLVRSDAFITMGCLCHMAILIDGFVYEISTGGQGSLSLAGDLKWQVHASETYQSSGYGGWVRVFGNPKCMRTRQELKQYAESLAGTRYDIMLENCQHFCKKMIQHAWCFL